MSVPYFPMYPTDFEADTSHLTLMEDGAYNRLLRLCWMTPGCSVPDDEEWVMRRMRAVTQDEKAVIMAVIDEFFERKSGRIFSPRLQREWKKVDETSRKRSEAGKKGGRPKATDNKQKSQKPGFDFDKAGPKQPEPEPYITSSLPKVREEDVPSDFDFIKNAVWKMGKPYLASKGIPERQAGSIIGRWISQANGDCAVVLDAIKLASKQQTDDPIPYVSRIIANGGNLRRHSTRKSGSTLL